MGDGTNLVASWVGVIALVSALSCGGSSATQRDNESPPDESSDVGGGESTGDSNAQSEPPDDPRVAPADDPVEAAIAAGNANKAKPAGQNKRKFKTSASPVKLSAFLVEPAEAAMKAKQYPTAISLYAGLVAARGKGDDTALDLGKAWNLAAQLEEAARVYDDFSEATRDDDKRVFAQTEVERLRGFDEPFQRTFAPNYATKQAAEAFKLGRASQKKKRWADALFYFQVAAAIDPTLNGPVREIGASYTKLGATHDATVFYLDYLWRSPAGKFTKDVLKALKKLKKLKKLGYLNVSSKLTCDEVWVEGQRVKRLPIKKKPMAPGKYTWLCYSGQYGMAYFETIRIAKGEIKSLEFAWAIVVNDLQSPWGRIVLEDARKPGVMRDLGISERDFGVIVPKDGSALKMQLRDPKEAIIEERFVRIKPGDKLVVKWKKK